MLGQLKADRAAGLLLTHGRPGCCDALRRHILDPEPDHIAAAELAVDGEVRPSACSLERTDQTCLGRSGGLLRHWRPASYVAFDVLWLNGKDLRNEPLIERKPQLRRLLPKRSPLICELVMVESIGRKLFRAVQEHELEGIVPKRKADPYRPGVRWWKIKNPAYSQAEGRRELF